MTPGVQYCARIGKRRVRHSWLLAAVLPLHLVFDRMWNEGNRVSLLWPWAGSDFPWIIESGVLEHLLRNLSDIATLLGEPLGLGILVTLWIQNGLSNRNNRAQFFRDGILRQ